MSGFAVGGNAGFALGPMLVALFCGAPGLGLAGTPLLAAPPVEPSRYPGDIAGRPTRGSAPA